MGMEDCHVDKFQIETAYKIRYEAGEVEKMADKKGIITLEFEMRTFPAPIKKFQNSASRIKFLNKLKEVDSESGDVDLNCHGKRIPCHKFLLISQSPVFKAMFESDSRESQENIVNIVDSTPTALKTFVRFLYSGNLVLGRIASGCLEHIFEVMTIFSW